MGGRRLCGCPSVKRLETGQGMTELGSLDSTSRLPRTSWATARSVSITRPSGSPKQIRKRKGIKEKKSSPVEEVI